MAFLALFAIISIGFTYGVDFSGGNEFQVRFETEVKAQDIRKTLEGKDIKASVQSFGEEKEFLIRTEAFEEKEHTEKLESLKSTITSSFKDKGVKILRVDSVGPQIGKELRQKGILALIYSLLMILIYLGLRFDAKYAPSAVFCLFHDAMITMSLFAILGWEVNVQTLAAILAIIGYSLNDTIVTFDRIRENVGLIKTKDSFYNICNKSINEVLSRTILTSLTTLIAIGAMYYFADGVIKDFAFTLGIGVIIGTYSSIYVATPLLLFINNLKVFNKKKKVSS